MAWYAYCITEQQAFPNGKTRRPFPIETLRGVENCQVLGYRSGEFTVIVSEYTRNGQLDQKAVLDHARVVSECFRNSTVLPFRFGTVFDTDEALRRSVRSNRKAFLESVERLRGKAEMHIKVVVKDAFVQEAYSEMELPMVVGGEYLVRLREKATRERERQTKARALSVQVHKLFNPLEEDVSCKCMDSGSMCLDIAHLIDSKSIPKYQNRFSTATRQLKDCQLVISGPWPPYHFMPGKLRTVASAD